VTKDKRREFAWIPLVDILFNMFLGFIALFALAIVSQGKPTEGNVILKGEYLVTMEWEPNSQADIDLFVRQGDNKVVSFIEKDIKSMTLDRDNMGSDDILRDANGDTIRNLPKRELVTVRGITPGYYTVNAFLYADHGDVRPQHVMITIERLNPYMIVYQGEKTLTVDHREETFIRFKIMPGGTYQDKDEYYSDKFASKLVANRNTSNLTGNVTP
jgi:hypothetical protein